MHLGSSFRALPPVTKNLLIINVIVWAFLAFAKMTAPGVLVKVTDLCALHYFTSETFNPAQLVTYMFMHQELMHLFFNMFALFMFGMIIERAMGSKRFLFYYITCGIGAGLIQEGVFAIMISHYAQGLPEGLTASQIATGEVPRYMMAQAGDLIIEIYSLINVPIIGASGAVFGILLAFGYLFPKAPLYLFFIPVPIQARWMVIGYGALELLLGVGNINDSVAHFAHLGGMLVGFLLLLYWKKKGVFNGNIFL